MWWTKYIQALALFEVERHQRDYINWSEQSLNLTASELTEWFHLKNLEKLKLHYTPGYKAFATSTIC